MTKLPRITARETEKILVRRGFFFVRQSGSHKIYRNKEGLRVTLPFHGQKILHYKIVKQILSDLKVTAEDL